LARRFATIPHQIRFLSSTQNFVADTLSRSYIKSKNTDTKMEGNKNFFELCPIGTEISNKEIKNIHYGTLGNPGISETLRQIRKLGF
jgi:hypothetical protein